MLIIAESAFMELNSFHMKLFAFMPVNVAAATSVQLNGKETDAQDTLLNKVRLSN